MWSEGTQEGGSVKERTAENKPATVPRHRKTGVLNAQQAGDIRTRWEWVEPQVWTARMLTALEKRVEGGKWFRLIDKVYALPTLLLAFKQVKANGGKPGIDHQTIAMYEHELERNLTNLSQMLREKTYRPQSVRRVWIPKPGSNEKRPLGIPTVRDRIVQAALRAVLEPIFERDFAEHSYGFRPKRSCKAALRQVDALLNQGYTWVLDADLKSYFDTIPHQRMMDRLKTKIADGRILDLVAAFLTQGVMEMDEDEYLPEAGTPQGGVISPLLSNIYLDPLDHWMAETGFEMVRYADDFVVLCRSEEHAQEALWQVRKWTEQEGLKLHPEKTRIVQVMPDWEKKDPGSGVDFLGYTFWRKWKWPRRKSQQKFRATIRDKTKRTNGQSLKEIIASVNRTLRGWFEYFKHSAKAPLIRLDKWVRMRLRSILRKRRKRRGRGRGTDHFRWPNAYFTANGLFSLTAARKAGCQSSQR
jgi:RNA-directed DNA polymerase